MEEQILEAYQAERSDQHGTLPKLTNKDREVAKLAASYTEAELRQAMAMRSAYERKHWRENKKGRERA